ncbi:predicted protein [Streptomyces viridochromogenes DSM 40736]|uniref:Predicted protein n=1 Tax=Streptomyces viridochromogenes (strain DSM 40736 / JCM 4977 / BCRC 1201 / Tue 494) TaxID=591159 RepID=D9XFR0_STRVT|nr:hypothetical protein [Streptomyces viridochromogenes]EFL34791.1 predicted protein [Streptomyces viridochromogenes DSM 40736]
MHLNWTALGEGTAVSVGATVAVVVVFTLGVLGLARSGGARTAEGGTSAPERRGDTHALGLAQAVLCFLGCAAVVAYGIYLIVPRFH